jgi:hypothetical protein
MASVAAAAWLVTSTGTRADQAPLPGAREIIDRFIKASGGASAFSALKTIRARGTLTIPGQQLSGSFELMAARPNKSLTRATIAGLGAIEEGYDGKVGWSIDPISGPSLVTGKGLTERADESWFDAPLHAPDFVREMTVVGREEWESRPAYRVKVVLRSGTEQMELFDVETGLQLGIVATRETPLGPMPTTTLFHDYKKFGTLMYPGRLVQRLLGIEQVVTITTYEFDSVPPAAFDLPPVIKALIK